MSWIAWAAPATIAVVAAVALWIWYSRDRAPVSSDLQIDLDTLHATLDDAGIDRGSTRIPDADILQPHISETDEFLGAVEGRRGNKRSILVALGDRLVAGEATLGAMGAEVVTIRWRDVQSFDQSFDIGGEVTFETAGATYTFTHLPRSQTREFAEIVRNRIESAD